MGAQTSSRKLEQNAWGDRERASSAHSRRYGPPGAYATLVVRRVLWFATESARPVLRSAAPESAPRPMSRPAPREPASTRPGTAGAAERKERPAAQPQGFLARQRARKAERAARREAARKPPGNR